MRIFQIIFAGLILFFSRPLTATAAPAGWVVGWGKNTSGQAIGIPIGFSSSNATGVVMVAGQVLTDVTAVAVGGGQSLALKTDGTVAAWGENSLGKAIGYTTEYPFRTNGQVKIDGTILGNIIAISAGQTHSIALNRDGTVLVWGATHDNRKIEVPSGLSYVVAIAAGGDGSLALKNDGTVLGLNMRVPTGLSNIIAIAVAKTPYSQGLVLNKDGFVIEWSRGVDFENGYVVASNAVAIAAGDGHGLALDRDGRVTEWGSYSSGFGGGSGSNSASNNSSKLVMIGGQILNNVMAIAAGGDNSMALKKDGTVVVWGNNWFHQTDVPVGLSNVVAIATSGGTCLAITTNRAVAEKFRH